METIKQISTYLGKKVTQQIDFKPCGTFGAIRKAESWASDNGYSYGSMCGDMPIAMFKDDSYVAKWKNLSKNERNQVDGVIISDDFREGYVTILLFREDI